MTAPFRPRRRSCCTTANAGSARGVCSSSCGTSPCHAARHPELADVDSVVWFEPTAAGGRVRYHSAAGLAVLRHLGGFWGVLGALGWLVPRPLRDAVYWAIAGRRFDLVAPACLLPTPEQRGRFLA